jgi:hypothetical protein
MNERLLQFIWQFQYYNINDLTTVDGLPLTIINGGIANTNQGPDFLQGKIKLGNTTWLGNIEIHIKSSDWNVHKHTGDANYNNVILHVVWNNDVVINDHNKQAIPTLELEQLVPKMMLQKYEQIMNAKGFVSCENYLPVLSDIGWLAWKERLIAERLEHKSKAVLAYLEQSNNHWEEVFWWMLCKNFGMKVNTDSFEQIGQSLSVNILAKHKSQIHQLEALLLGQAGFLHGDFNEDYPRLLQREYNFLAKKFKLKKISRAPDFLRMRPGNFPTLRLAQLAMLVHQSTHLLSKILEINKINDLRKLMDVTANDYWHYHYHFDEETTYKPKSVGSSMTENIIINTIIPVLFAYGIQQDSQYWKEKAIGFLSQLPAEINSITRQWKNKNVSNQNAFDSQSLVELKNNYCNQKRCLNCAVGNKILQNIEEVEA